MDNQEFKCNEITCANMFKLTQIDCTNESKECICKDINNAARDLKGNFCFCITDPSEIGKCGERFRNLLCRVDEQQSCPDLFFVELRRGGRVKQAILVELKTNVTSERNVEKELSEACDRLNEDNCVPCNVGVKLRRAVVIPYVKNVNVCRNNIIIAKSFSELYTKLLKGMQ